MMTPQQHPALFVLASLLTSYPDHEAEAYIHILLNDSEVLIPENLRSTIMQFIDRAKLEDLQSEYIGIFDHGRVANPIYETEYGRHRAMAKGQELSDIAGFYNAFGFHVLPGDAGSDMLDHVSIELEFYALLLMKQLYLSEHGDTDGGLIVADGRRKFLEGHLGRFVRAIGNRPGVLQSPFYRDAFTWCADLIDRECADLGVSVLQVGWVDDPVAREDALNCGLGKTPGGFQPHST